MLQIFQFLVLCLVGVAFSNPIFSPFNPGYILTRFGLRSQNSIFYPVTSLERSEDPFATVDEEPDDDDSDSDDDGADIGAGPAAQKRGWCMLA